MAVDHLDLVEADDAAFGKAVLIDQEKAPVVSWQALTGIAIVNKLLAAS